MKKTLIYGLAGILALAALTGCSCGGPRGSSSLVFDPDDSLSKGSIVGQKTFEDALNYNYDNFSVYYGQMYGDGNFVEYAYEWFIDGISIVMDQTYAEQYGSIVYDFYASTEEDDYAYWKKSSGYQYDGWIANGYRDLDLGMQKAYFNLNYFLETLTMDDIESVLGMYYIKESSMRRMQTHGLEFFGDPFSSDEEITSVSFQIDPEIGAITKIIGSVSDKSDDGFEIRIFDHGVSKAPAGVTVPKAPYYKSETDRNIYTYAEMLGDKYVPDVWPETVALHTVGNPKKENGYDAVIDIGESVEIYYDYTPSNTNRYEFEWVTSDKEVIDLNYKVNGLENHHKYASGIKAGEAYVSIKLQIEDGSWIESNKLKIKVNGLKPIDKTNAVYDLTITGSEDEYTLNGENKVYNKNVTNIFAYNAVNTTAQQTIKGHNTKAMEAKNAEGFGDDGMVLVVSPAAQEFMHDDQFYSSILFDFDDQQVVSIDFYYSLYKSNQRGAALENFTEAYLVTSNDGENWSAPIDLKQEFITRFDNYNLNYDANLNLMSRTFQAASKVKLYFKANMVGKNFQIAMNNFVFKNDDTCNNHGVQKIPVTSIAISSNKTACKANETIQFSVTSILPTDATDKRVTWVSSDPTVGTIAASGLFKAATAGTTKIYALSSNNVKSNEIEVTVIGQEYLDQKYVGRVYYLDDEDTGFAGVKDVLVTITSNEYLNLTYKLESGNDISLDFQYYTKDDSANPEHLYYHDNDELKIKFYDNNSNKKTIEVFASGNGVTYELGNTHTNCGSEFSLYIASTSIAVKHDGLEVTSATIKVNETYNVIPVVNPTGARYQEVTATSNNAAVATVKEGTYYGFDIVGKSSGTAVISFTNGEVTRTLNITVSEPVGVISLNCDVTSKTIQVSETFTASLSLNPSNADNYNITWVAEDASVVTITPSANKLSATIVGKKVGNTVITVKDSISNQSVTLTVNVTASTSAVDLKYVGTYVGVDDNGDDFSFTINADGSAVFTILGESYNFTLTAPQFGCTLCFTYDEDDSVIFGFYGSPTFGTMEIHDDNNTLNYTAFACYGESLMVTKE